MRRIDQGQSAITIDKERRIGAALSISMRIAEKKFGGGNFRYWHFDANAGSGWNETVNVPGSPIVFWRNAETILKGMRPRPFFCDIRKDAMKELQDRLAKEGGRTERNSILIPGDNAEGLSVFAETIRRTERNPSLAVGTIIVDPNGWWYRAKDGNGAPVNAVTEFSKEFPRIDIVLNISAGNYGRFNSTLPYMRPDAVLDSLNKQQWLIALTGGQSRFLLAVGRNLPTHEHRALGMHDRNSDIGRSIISRAEGSRQQAISDLSPIPGAPCVSGGASNSDASGERTLPVRRKGNRSTPPQRISAVGNVRRAIEPSSDLPQLPFAGAR